MESGELKIIEDGKIPKFVHDVYRIYFSDKEALKHQKEILYITERAVFKLTHKGIQLEEIAPGVDLEKNVLDKMEFPPVVGQDLIQMDPLLFRDSNMEIRKDLIENLLEKRQSVKSVNTLIKQKVRHPQ